MFINDKLFSHLTLSPSTITGEDSVFYLFYYIFQDLDCFNIKKQKNKTQNHHHQAKFKLENHEICYLWQMYKCVSCCAMTDGKRLWNTLADRVWAAHHAVNDIKEKPYSCGILHVTFIAVPLLPFLHHFYTIFTPFPLTEKSHNSHGH